MRRWEIESPDIAAMGFDSAWYNARIGYAAEVFRRRNDVGRRGPLAYLTIADRLHDVSASSMTEAPFVP